MADPDAPDHRSDGPEPSRGTCPICGRARVAAYRPFCSKRCADVDLSRWLGGKYAVPGQPLDDLTEAMGRADGASRRSGDHGDGGDGDGDGG